MRLNKSKKMNFRHSPLLIAVVIVLTGCSKIVPDLEVVRDSASTVSTNTSGDTGTGIDTDTTIATETLLADTVTATERDTATETHEVPDTATNSDSSSDTPVSQRDVCIAEGRYWYDETDVAQTTPDGFANLSPICHDVATSGCPTVSNDTETSQIVWGMRADNSFVVGQTDTQEIYMDGSETGVSPHPVTHVFSTIRCMPYLSTVTLRYNRIQEANFANNPYLTYIDLYNNDVLEWIGIPLDADIEELHLNNNALREINVSHLSSLSSAYLAENNFTRMDLSGVRDLRYVYLQNNALESVIMPTESPYLALATLEGNNLLRSFEIPDCRSLQSLNLYGTSISELDLSQCANLIDVDVSNTSIGSVDVAAAGENLRNFGGNYTSLQSLNLQSNPNIEEVQLYGSMPLTELLLAETTPYLHLIYLNDTGIRELDISGADNLDTLHATGGSVNLTFLDFSEKRLLSDTMVYGNSFGDVDLSDCASWTDIDLHSSKIASIILPESARVSTLNLNDNRIEKIELPLPGVIGIDLGANYLNYTGELDDYLSFIECDALQAIDITGNTPLTLRIDANAFPETFLTSSESMIFMTADQWNTRTIVDDALGWDYDDTCGCARLVSK
jgi:uncharacterized protein YjbI with pentapeptide repeats